MQDNNKYIEPTDPHLEELEDDNWVNLTHVEHITSEFNRSITPIGTEDLKVGDIFESKLNCCKQLPSDPFSVECHLCLVRPKNLLYSSLFFHYKG